MRWGLSNLPKQGRSNTRGFTGAIETLCLLVFSVGSTMSLL